MRVPLTVLVDMVRCIRLFRKADPQAESIKAADTKRIVLMVL